MAWSRVLARWSPFFACVAAVGIGFAAMLSATVTRATILNSGFYAEALETTDIYDRVYEDALADPELEEAAGRLLGGIDVQPSLQVALLRQVLPPDDLRVLTEGVLVRLVAYLDGDAEALHVSIDLTSTLRAIEPATVAYVRERLERLNTTVLPDLDALVAELAPIAAQLGRGEVPEQLLPLADVLPEQAPVAALRILGAVGGPPPPPSLVRQVEASIAAGDMRGAVVAAAEHFASPSVRHSVQELRDGLAPGGKLRLLRLAAQSGGGTGGRVVAELDTARDLAAWSRPMQIGGLGTMMAGAIGLVLWCRAREIPVSTALAAALLMSGLAALAVWAVVSVAVDVPLDGARSGQWDIPEPVRLMLSDVFATMGAELTRLVLLPALTLVALGMFVGVAAALAGAEVLDLRDPLRRRAAILGTGALALVILVAAVAVARATRNDEPRACNGHVELCDRRFDQVVFAATHNSMSSADRGWIWPAHDRGIAAQLDSGIRALLVDTHYWEGAEDVLDALAELPEPATPAVVDVVTRVVEPRPGAFLCHNLCRLGATPLDEGLGEIARFLDRNPEEVVVLFVQDHISAPDMASAMRRSGLRDDVFVKERGEGWPTLGEMIDDGERLVVLAENSGPPPAWYHRGFALVQETPFRFSGPEEFSCGPNRGTEHSPLLLMNHWIERTAPSRADATVVNRQDVIVRRARQCIEQRGMLTNLIAVNFASIGGLLPAVDELNGV
jgi:hypothetical protein